MFSIGEKWNLEPMGNFAYNTEFLILGKALLILLPFYIILEATLPANAPLDPWYIPKAVI